MLLPGRDAAAGCRLPVQYDISVPGPIGPGPVSDLYLESLEATAFSLNVIPLLELAIGEIIDVAVQLQVLELLASPYAGLTCIRPS